MELLKKLLCSHKWKFVEGQRVYFTKYKYELICKKCGKIKDFYPEIALLDVEKKLDEFGQEIRNGCIV